MLWRLALSNVLEIGPLECGYFVTISIQFVTDFTDHSILPSIQFAFHSNSITIQLASKTLEFL
jgi:hypothetical protein